LKKQSASQSAFKPRVLIGFVLCSAGVSLTLLGFGPFPGGSALAQGPPQIQKPGVQVVASYHNDISPPLRDMLLMPLAESKGEREANLNPKIPNHHIIDSEACLGRKLQTSSTSLGMTE
jgi:hypothetical protein